MSKDVMIDNNSTIRRDYMELLTLASTHVLQRNDPTAVQHHKDIQEGFLLILTQHHELEEASSQHMLQVHSGLLMLENLVQRCGHSLIDSLDCR